MVKCELCEDSEEFKDNRGLMSHVRTHKMSWKQYKEKYASGRTAKVAEEESVDGEGGEDPVPEGLSGLKDDILRSVGAMLKEFSKHNSPDNEEDLAETEGGKKIEVDEGTMVKRTIYVTPKTLVYFDIAVSDGYEGNLSAFFNEMVNLVYEKKGIALGMVQKRII